MKIRSTTEGRAECDCLSYTKMLYTACVDSLLALWRQNIFFFSIDLITGIESVEIFEVLVF